MSPRFKNTGDRRFVQLPEVTVESPRAEYNNPVYGDVPDTASPNWDAYMDSLDLYNMSREILGRVANPENEHLQDNIIDIEATEEGHLRNLFVDDAALTQQIEHLERILRSHDESDTANIEPIKKQLNTARKQHEMITRSIDTGIYPNSIYKPPFYKFGWTDQHTPLFKKPTAMPTRREIVDKGEPTITTQPLNATPLSGLPPSKVEKRNPYARFGRHWGRDWVSTSGEKAPLQHGYQSSTTHAPQRHGFYYKAFKEDGSHDILTPEERKRFVDHKKIRFKQ